VYGVVWRFEAQICQITHILSVVKPIKLTLYAKCTIHDVTNWPFLSVFQISFCLRIGVGRAGRLFGKFGCRVGFERFANVPDSEGTVSAGFLMM
jgi:hypothetical protein